MMKASEVIRIGRSLRRHASFTALQADLPESSSSRANSTIRMAFLDASPTRTINPICVKILLSPMSQPHPGKCRKDTHWDNHNDSQRSVRLSYWAASTRNTRNTQSGKIQTALLPARICWQVRSVHSYSTPGGSVFIAIRSISSIA